MLHWIPRIWSSEEWKTVALTVKPLRWPFKFFAPRTWTFVPNGSNPGCTSQPHRPGPHPGPVRLSPGISISPKVHPDHLSPYEALVNVFPQTSLNPASSRKPPRCTIWSIRPISPYLRDIMFELGGKQLNSLSPQSNSPTEKFVSILQVRFLEKEIRFFVCLVFAVWTLINQLLVIWKLLGTIPFKLCIQFAVGSPAWPCTHSSLWTTYNPQPLLSFQHAQVNCNCNDLTFCLQGPSWHTQSI